MMNEIFMKNKMTKIKGRRNIKNCKLYYKVINSLKLKYLNKKTNFELFF